jgi:hypothetical protein
VNEQTSVTTQEAVTGSKEVLKKTICLCFKNDTTSSNTNPPLFVRYFGDYMRGDSLYSLIDIHIPVSYLFRMICDVFGSMKRAAYTSIMRNKRAVCEVFVFEEKKNMITCYHDNVKTLS